MKTEPRARWGHPILLGCVGILGLACVVVAILAVVNWSRISTYFREEVAELQEFGTVQKVLQEKYLTSLVSVQGKRSDSVPGVTLCIELINAPVFEGLDLAGPNGKEKALEIAVTSRDALPAQNGFERYEITFVVRKNLGLTLRERRSFVFEAKDLPPFEPR